MTSLYYGPTPSCIHNTCLEALPKFLTYIADLSGITIGDDGVQGD